MRASLEVVSLHVSEEFSRLFFISGFLLFAFSIAMLRLAGRSLRSQHFAALFPTCHHVCCTSEIQHIDDVVANFSQEFLSGGAAGQSLKARCICELALHATLA